MADQNTDDFNDDLENGDDQNPSFGNDSTIRDQLRNLSLQLSSEIKKRRHIENSLAATVGSLTRENERLATQQNNDWRLPNLILSGLACLGGILVVLLGLHVGSQFQTTFSLNERSTQIHDEVIEAGKHRLATIAMFRDEMEKVDTMRTGMQASYDEFQKEFRDELSLAQKDLSRLKADNEMLQRIGTASNNVLPLLAFADVSMSVAHDYDQAQIFALRAEKELGEIQQQLKAAADKSPSQNELLEKLGTQIQTLLHKAMTIACECHLNRGDIDAARGLLAELATHPLADERSLMLQGLVSLNDCCLLSDRSAITARARAAQEHIKSSLELHARQTTGGSVADSNRLYLAASMMLGNDFDAAAMTVGDFIAKRMEGIEGTYRLSSVDKASLELAELLLLVSNALAQPSLQLPDFECKLNVGSLTPHDGRLFENIIIKLVQSRNEVFPERAKANEFGMLGLKTILALRSACADRYASQNCPGCGGETVVGGVYREDADRFMAELGLWPCAKYPVPHRGGQFVAVDAGSVRLQKVVFTPVQKTRTVVQTRIEHQERTREVDDAGEIRVETFTVVVPVPIHSEQVYTVAEPRIEDVWLAAGQEIAPDLYVPLDITADEIGYQLMAPQNSPGPEQATPAEASVVEPGPIPAAPDPEDET